MADLQTNCLVCGSHIPLAQRPAEHVDACSCPNCGDYLVTDDFRPLYRLLSAEQREKFRRTLATRRSKQQKFLWSGINHSVPETLLASYPEEWSLEFIDLL